VRTRGLNRYSDSLRTGPSGVRIPMRVDYPYPSRPNLGPTKAPYVMNTGSFQEVKRPGRGVDHPPLSRAEVKERVEL